MTFSIIIIEAENTIKQIEIKRQMLDEELRLARNKIRHSEESQQILEEKLMVNFYLKESINCLIFS